MAGSHNGPIVSDDNETARTSYCCGSINISNSHLNVKKVGKTELLAKDEDSMVSQSVPKGGVSALAQRSKEEEFQDIKMVTCTGKLGEPLLGRIKEKGNLRTHAYQSVDIEVPEIHRKQTNKSLGTFSIDLMDTRVIDAAIKEVEYQHIGESKVLRLPPECSSKDSSARDLYIILDLNGVLIKRWDKHPGLPCVSKLNKKWIQLRPGCINFVCNIFSKFKVGIWSTMTRKNTVGICKLIEQQAHQRLPFFMLWDKDFCYQHKATPFFL
ncbi:hypothetical protein KP509_38G064000 [Ceratopteris richardii]|uniref:FCP1 homology domain-containing protein n=1 Tax=Ceratopteris richardii TaxID=49495 RepID=A0A8T2Q5H5_CERRI|nr:hypothetical protein KP509_38G064000 [Ceratopteris richardii]